MEAGKSLLFAMDHCTGTVWIGGVFAALCRYGGQTLWDLTRRTAETVLQTSAVR